MTSIAAAESSSTQRSSALFNIIQLIKHIQHIQQGVEFTYYTFAAAKTFMNPIVTSSFQITYVVFSFFIALIGSLIALLLASHIKQTDGSFSTLHALMAGMSLGGVGVWTTHFVGMMALKLDVASSYSLVETGLSMVLVVAASSLALGFVARAPKQMNRKILAGSVLGLSVATMHYIGMYGIRFGGYITWDYAYVAASAVIAVVAATVALHLSFQSTTLMQRLGSAELMAVGICAMHYTGMEAANFVCTTENRTAFQRGFGYVTSFEVLSLVIIAVVTMISLGIIFLMFQPIQLNRRA